MRIKGKEINEPNIELIFIPRESGDIILKAKCVESYEEFDALCPDPKPKIKTYRDGTKKPLLSDPEYKKAKEEHSEKRIVWLLLKSLEATEELEWETVDMADPETWANYEKELIDSHFSDIERSRILQGVLSANGLDESRIDEARKRFLAIGEEQEEESNSPEEELSSI